MYMPNKKKNVPEAFQPMQMIVWQVWWYLHIKRNNTFCKGLCVSSPCFTWLYVQSKLSELSFNRQFWPIKILFSVRYVIFAEDLVKQQIRFIAKTNRKTIDDNPLYKKQLNFKLNSKMIERYKELHMCWSTTKPVNDKGKRLRLRSASESAKSGQGLTYWWPGWRRFGYSSFHKTHNQEYGQTGWMLSLIWVCDGCISRFLMFLIVLELALSKYI